MGTQNDLLLSIGSAIFSSLTQITKLAFEAHAVKESFFQYSLTCFMARIGWVPFRTKARKVLEREDLKSNACFGCIRKKGQMQPELFEIDYDIKYKLPIISSIHTTYQQVEYDFSENTLKDLMATLMLRKGSEDDEYEWGDGPRLEIKFHESLSLLSIAQLV